MKRFTIVAVSLGFIVVSLLIARPGLTDQPSEKTAAKAASLAELQKERIETLQKIVENVTKQYEKGSVEYLELAKAQNELIEAKLDATDKPNERIALLEEQLKIAQDCFQFFDGQYKAGFGHVVETDVLRVKAHGLAIEIKLVKEQSGKKM